MTKKEFVDRFWENFIECIPLSIRKKHGIQKTEKQFMWDVFASKLCPCLEGELANAEFDKVDKTEAIEIQYNYFGMSYDHTRPCSYQESKDVKRIPEFYVIGKDFQWCYVITHELDLCGPYFCYNTIKSKE